jgi:hypothetical protein
MDPKLFRQRLEELAELKVVKEPRTADRREAEDADSIWRDGKEYVINPKDNPTLNIAIARIKPMIKACEDCGLMVEDRLVHVKIYDNPYPHWRKNCISCKMTEHPLTGCFDTPSPTASKSISYELKCLNSRPVFKKPTK